MIKPIFKRLLLLSTVFLAIFYYVKRPQPPRKFDLQIDEDHDKHIHLPTGQGLTKAHALHFYEIFLDILLNKHNRFPGHAENVHLLNYILRNPVKWRVTETAMFKVLDVTGNEYINKKEFESFTNLFPRIADRRLIDNFHSIIDRNIDTKIVKAEWFQFCNKNLRPKLIQDLQQWEENYTLYLNNPYNVSAQFTAKNKMERNHRDLIHGQMDRALDMMAEDFMMFIEHWEHNTPHTIDDPDMFVRRLGYWILNRFERWDVVYMWLYQMLDDNGDGRLEPLEVKHQFQEFVIPQIRIKELYDYLDEDGDSVIERAEWQDWSETMRKLLVNHFKEVEPKMEDYQ